MAESERACGGQSPDIPHGLNSMKSAFWRELGRSQSQSQQPVLGGQMYGHQVLQTRQNEMNHLGADSESNRHNLMSRESSMLEAQVGNDSNTFTDNLMRFDTTESLAKCNFFGGQQQLSGQYSGMLQSLSGQQSGARDMQLLQQQAMFKQMQELKRQQLQRQQQENINQSTAVSSQTMGNGSTPINGIPVRNASDFSWSSFAVDNNRLQRGSSPVMQGSSTRHMVSPQHNQAFQLMGMVPQVDNSIYGVPVSSMGNIGQYSHPQRVCGNSFSGNQYVAPEQVSKRVAARRQELRGKSMSGLRNTENDLKNSLVPESHPWHEVSHLRETSQEKPAMPAATSQSVATLDPTEEKILFGSDDSVWDVFGRSAGTGMGASYMLDGTYFALPSMSSGKWSALMQSAVTETSSDDVTLQEQCNGLSAYKTAPHTGNLQMSANIASGKPQSFCPDGSLRYATSLNPMPSPFSADVGTGTSYGSTFGDLTTGLENRHNQTENLQAYSSQRSMQQFSIDGNKWLNRNSVGEGPPQGNNVCANVSNSLGVESNIKHTSGSWPYPSSGLSYNNSDQQSNGHIGWNFIDSLSPAGEANSRGHINETDGDIREKMGEAGTNVSSPHIKREHGGSTVGCFQVNKEDPKLDSGSTIANLNNTKAVPENNTQQLLHGHNLAFWKHVSPFVISRGSTTPENFHPNMVTHSKSFGLAGNNGLDKGAAERHVDDSNRKENSSDSFCSNASQHTSGGSTRRENVWLNAGDSHNLLGSREKSYKQGCVPAFWGQTEALHMDPSISMITANPRDASAKFDGSVGNFSNTTPSKNMLELFGEADQQKGHDPSRNLSSSGCYPSSELPAADHFYGVGHNQQNKTSASQQFGLQLGPPSQKLIIKDQTSFTQSPGQLFNSFNSPYVSSGAFPQAANQVNKAFNSPFPYPINCLQHQAFANSSEQLTTHQSPNPSFYGFSMQLQQANPSSERSRIPDQASIANVCRSAQSNNLFPPAETCQPNNTNQFHIKDPGEEFSSLEAMPVSQLSAIASMFQKGTSVDSSPKLQHDSPIRNQSLPSHATDFSNSHTLANYDVEQTFSRVQPDGQHAHGNLSRDTVASNPQGVGESQSMTGNMHQPISAEDGSAPVPLGTSQNGASIVNQLPDAFPSSTATAQRDIEMFVRSPRSNEISENLSLVHQMQFMRQEETDPSSTGVKRFRGLDPEPVASRGQQILNYTTTVKDVSVNHTPAFTRCEHPQMAPSWFDQYGTFKNGQISPVHGAKTSMVMKVVDHPITARGSPEHSLACSLLDKMYSVADASQLGIQQSVNPVLIVNDQFSSPQLLTPPVNDGSFAVKTKKRKSGVFEMIPWSKEVLQCSQGLRNSSMSEVEWAHASNRLIEKVENDNGMIEGFTPMRRSKRRLVITTQLLQQLLCAPPASVISADAIAHNENIIYYISRVALGDACSSISFQKDSRFSHGSRTLPSDKGKESERFSEVLLKVAANLIGRAKQLEEDILKLEKGVSVLDLQLECQELEKFSIINRFAKFHSRSQADRTYALSSSHSNVNYQNPYPQRYVTAVPISGNIPNRVQCLSL